MQFQGFSYSNKNYTTFKKIHTLIKNLENK